MIHRVAVLCVAIGIASGCAPQVFESAGTRQDVVKEVFGGQENFDFMLAAPVVQACRLKLKVDPSESGLVITDYEEGSFVPLREAQAGELRSVLQSPDSYLFTLAKSCAPIYGVRIRFQNKEESLDVDLCFSCDILTVSRHGEYVAGEDFDPIRPKLVALCKQLFPGDSEIQQLSAR